MVRFEHWGRGGRPLRSMSGPTRASPRATASLRNLLFSVRAAPATLSPPLDVSCVLRFQRAEKGGMVVGGRMQLWGMSWRGDGRYAVMRSVKASRRVLSPPPILPNHVTVRYITTLSVSETRAAIYRGHLSSSHDEVVRVPGPLNIGGDGWSDFGQFSGRSEA